MKKSLLVLFMVCISVFLVGCGGSNGGTGGDTISVNKDSKTIKLGVIAPLSGPAATYGGDILQGYEVVLEEINDAGGINGKEVELIIEDGKCTGKDATAAVQKLINVDNVVAILGGACSGETIPAGKIAQAAGVPMVSAGSSSPEISSIGDYVFRYWNDADAGKVMLEYLEEQGAQNIGLIYEGTDYAAAYADVIRMGFKGTLLIETKFQSEEKDFSIIAKDVANKLDDLDAVVFIPQAEANVIPFVKALQNENVWEAIREKMLGTEVVITDTVAKELGDAANGMKGVRFPTLDAFGEETVKKAATLTDGYDIQTADVFVVFGADSLALVAEAIEANGTDGEAIKSYLAGVNEGNKRNEYVPGFYFNQFGDGQGIPFALVEINGGEVVSVE